VRESRMRSLCTLHVVFAWMDGCVRSSCDLALISLMSQVAWFHEARRGQMTGPSEVRCLPVLSSHANARVQILRALRCCLLFSWQSASCGDEQYQSFSWASGIHSDLTDL
jgi:hypothetical protein